MIRFNKLTTRPRSTHTVYQFGGLWHNLENGGLSLENKLPCRWYDERNLGHDAAPAMSLRKRSGVVTNIDGNEIPADNRIIASISEGGRPVILDDHGILYCGGHSVNTVGANGVLYQWNCTWDDVQAIVSINPRAGATYDATKFDGMVSITPKTVKIVCVNGGSTDPHGYLWYTDEGIGTDPMRALTATLNEQTIGGINFNVFTLTDLDLEIRLQNWVPDGWTVYLYLHGKNRYSDGTYMVRMGSNVIILPEGVMVNAAKLEAGETVDVETLNAELRLPFNTPLYFSPCMLDGTIIVPEVGTTEPNDTTKIWADTTGDTTVMRQWVSALESWQAMQATYIRIDIGSMDQGTDWLADDIRQWDAVRFETDPYSVDYYDSSNTNIDENSRLGDEMHYLINSSQVVYKRVDDTSTNPETHYIVIQGILDEAVHVYTFKEDGLKITRKIPQMDFVVECANRLWGCYYGPDGDGNILNEIYACKLGDPRNWSVYMGLSTDSWTASRGGRAPFTGAAVLDNSPLFFREESLEKVYPSSSGAHQVQTFDLDGVEPGAHRTLCVIDNKLYYKARRGVMVYTGTIPQLCSAAFGDLVFTGISAARYKHRYLIVLQNASNEKVLGVYDIASGEWYMETEVWDPICVTYQDKLWYRKYFEAQPLVVPPVAAHYSYVQYDAWGGDDVEWYAESGIIGYELPEHRFISCIRIRLQMPYGSRLKAYIQYEDGNWQEKMNINQSDWQTLLVTKEINLYPLRCDHFRFKLTGKGPFKIVSISYRMERSEGGH